jgi:hypothetical protein
LSSQVLYIYGLPSDGEDDDESNSIPEGWSCLIIHGWGFCGRRRSQVGETG